MRNADNFITEDLMSGRMVEVIESGEPAIIGCHWLGVYFNGEKTGFNILKQVKKRLDQKYDNLVWMKLSEIARYWAAKELTTNTVNKGYITFKAPFSSPGFSVKLNASVRNPGIKRAGGELIHFERIKDKKALKANTWHSEKTQTFLCFNLEKGINNLILS